MEYLVIRNNKEEHYIKCEDINYLKAEGRYTLIMKINNKGKKYLYCKSLSALEKDLPDNFIRIHHSYIINLHNCMNRKNKTVFMMDGIKLTISHRKFSMVTKRISKYFRESD